MEDVRRWSLCKPNEGISSNNLPTAQLVLWAEQGIIKPGYSISADGGETWVPAENLPELDMRWYILAPNLPPYGPVTQTAARALIDKRYFPQDAILSTDPGTIAPSNELPLILQPDTRQQELDEAKQRLTLLEKELRLKDKRIDELTLAFNAQQAELNVENKPDAALLQQQLQEVQQAYQQLKSRTQEAAEVAASQESSLKQRIRTLETALTTAQSNLPLESNESPDQALYSVLSTEATLLMQAQDEDQDFLAQIQALSRKRLQQQEARLIAIRKLIGDSPASMIANAQTRTVPSVRFVHTKSDEAQTQKLQSALSASIARESDLQKRLIALEGATHQMQLQIAQAERKTLDSLQLDEKLRTTLKSLDIERKAREEEHRENAYIQEQLSRRIEELERLGGTNTAPAYEEPEPPPPQKTTSSFGWLRKNS